MKSFLVALALLCLTVPLSHSPASAEMRVVRAESAPEVPGIKVLIVGPESVDYGDFVTLDASGSDADEYSWHLAGATMASYAVSDDGKKVYFSAKPSGRHTFVLAAWKNPRKANVDIPNDVDHPGILLQTSHTIIAGNPPGPIPIPTPGPGPGPAPTPGPTPLPAGKYGLAEYTRGLVQANIPAGNRTVCTDLAANFSVVSLMCGTRDAKGAFVPGSIKSVADASNKLKDRNNQTIGTTNKQLWLSGVFTQLSAKLGTLGLGTTDMENLSTAYNEISTGFAVSSN